MSATGAEGERGSEPARDWPSLLFPDAFIIQMKQEWSKEERKLPARRKEMAWNDVV